MPLAKLIRLTINRHNAQVETMMTEAFGILFGGVISVFCGMALLYVSIRVTAKAVEKVMGGERSNG